jgi:hypothetical protein
MEFVALGLELIPLHAGMEDVQDVVKDFVEREFWLWSFFRRLMHIDPVESG